MNVINVREAWMYVLIHWTKAGGCGLSATHIETGDR